mgnify:CR=1 FL=1
MRDGSPGKLNEVDLLTIRDLLKTQKKLWSLISSINSSLQ